jgi:hypothetical protein
MNDNRYKVMSRGRMVTGYWLLVAGYRTPNTGFNL